MKVQVRYCAVPKLQLLDFSKRKHTSHSQVMIVTVGARHPPSSECKHVLHLGSGPLVVCSTLVCMQHLRVQVLY